MTAHQIAERLDYYGSYYDVNIDRDYAYISFCMLSKFFDETLAVAEQILLHPVFPEEELRTYCAKRKQRLAVERTKVDTQAREAFARALFGPSHPYGISADEAQYDKLTRGDVAAFYESHYTADNGFTICSGRIGDHERQAVAALAERLPRREPQAGIPFPAPVTQHEVRVDHPGAVQSSIRIGRLLFPRQHPDFLGMQVVASALGGYFGSRLMQNLREEHGYTYGVVAAMVNFEREGYFAVAAQVGTEVTQDALREIYTEIERLRAEPMPEGELSLVKNIMVGEMMRIPRRAVRHCRRYDREHPLRPRPYRHQREHPPHTGHDAGRRAATGSEIPLPRRTGDGHCGRPAKIDACALRLRSNTPPAERHEKSTGNPGAFPFPPPVHTVRPSRPGIRRLEPAPKLRYPTSTTRRDYFRLAATQLVSCTKSATESCSARCVKNGMFCAAEIAEHRPQRVADHLRRWPNDAFTTFTNSASSQPSRPTLLRRRRITALLTLGGGLKTVSLTVKRYSMSYHACNNTLRMPYSFDPGGSAIRTATSFWIIPTHSGTSRGARAP